MLRSNGLRASVPLSNPIAGSSLVCTALQTSELLAAVAEAHWAHCCLCWRAAACVS